MSMYKLAAKMKYRFKVHNGVVSVEDLWHLPMVGIGSIDELAITMDKEIKSQSQDSFVKPKDPVSKELQAKFDLVLDVIETRTKELNLRANAAAKKIERDKLLGAKVRMQDKELEGLSVEEIDEKLAALDED